MVKFMALLWLHAVDGAEMARFWLVEQTSTQKVSEETLLIQHQTLGSKFLFFFLSISWLTRKSRSSGGQNIGTGTT